MQEVLNQILNELKTLKSGQDELKTDVTALKTDIKEIKRLTSAIFNQTADLSEFKTNTTDSLDRIEKELREIETVTAKNCFDITRLKAIK